MSINNPFESARTQMRTAYQFLAPEYAHEFEALLSPERIIEVSIPIRMDDGSTRTFTGYRSQHNAARWPYKWGIRYHEDVTKDEVMALSAWMSIKTATLDLPLGGGKWGIIVDPKTLSKWELERLSRGWVQKLYKYIGSFDDVPAPDVNTNGEIMSWMVDEYSNLSDIGLHERLLESLSLSVDPSVVILQLHRDDFMFLKLTLYHSEQIL